MALKANKLLLSAALLCSVSAQAANVETNTAHMQAMDKITGRVSEIDVPVNSVVHFGSFSILVRKCFTRTPEETPENTAFVDVVDDYDNKEPVNIFKGWMLSSSPALNAVEHPIYDVWLLSCINKDNADAKKLSDDELKARDEIKMVRDSDKKDDNSVEEKVEIQPISEKKNETKEEPISDFDKMIQETIEKGVEPSSEENLVKAEVKPTPEIVEVVVTTPEETPETAEAPQALIQIQEKPVAPTEKTEEALENKEVQEETSDEEVIFEFEDENGFDAE